uniref:O-methyltransferase C-terminal domain-containing protein n=1 Tax=Populus trichocarpa TaxID=3694 RepID=A0A2K1XDM2_POPTR
MDYKLDNVVNKIYQQIKYFPLRTTASQLPTQNNDAPFMIDLSAREISTPYLWREFWMHGGFEGVKTLVDVGSDDGSVLNMIISNYPAVKGIDYDLAQL